jgi:cation diffusion facilitator family transporter
VEERRTFAFVISTYAILTVIKLMGGVLSGSLALIADGVDNVYNILTSFLAYKFYIMSKMPADVKHPYGHSKFDTLGSIIISMIMISVGSSIVTASMINLSHPVNEVGIYYASISLIIMICVSVAYLLLGKRTGSSSIKSELRHTLSDLLQTTLSLISVLLSLSVSPIFNGSIASIVGALLIYQAGKNLWEVKDVIVDSEISEVRNTVEETLRGINNASLRKVVTTFSGRNTVRVELYIQVDSKMSVEESHEIAHQIEGIISKSLKGKVEHCIVHVEPIGSHEEE